MTPSICYYRGKTRRTAPPTPSPSLHSFLGFSGRAELYHHLNRITTNGGRELRAVVDSFFTKHETGILSEAAR